MLTEKQAKALGYRIVRGAYTGTTDDRADRWYIEHAADTVMDRRGDGYFTKRDALRDLEETLDNIAWANAQSQALSDQSLTE